MQNNLRRVILVNFSLIFSIIFLPKIFLSSYRFSRSLIGGKTPNKNEYPYYPVYKNKEISKQTYIEIKKLKYSFTPFLGWKSNLMNQKYTNIEGEYGTRRSINQDLDSSIWFFGGSTMWGSGTTDNETIPSLYAKKSGSKVMNFGQRGWNSRQSLNQLINALGDGYKPNTVIFYDGYNDVGDGCKVTSKSLPTYENELLIKDSLKRGVKRYINRSFIENLFEPYFIAFKKFGIIKLREAKVRKVYICDSNQLRAKKIANHLLQNWYTAYSIAKANGFRFIAILQPTLFTSETPNYYLPRIQFIIKDQHNIVYPIIRSKIKSYCKIDSVFCESIIDGSRWIKNKEPIFIDSAHVSGEGNEIIVEQILSSIQKNKSLSK